MSVRVWEVWNDISTRSLTPASIYNYSFQEYKFHFPCLRPCVGLAVYINVYPHNINGLGLLLMNKLLDYPAMARLNYSY